MLKQSASVWEGEAKVEHKESGALVNLTRNLQV